MIPRKKEKSEGFNWQLLLFGVGLFTIAFCGFFVADKLDQIQDSQIHDYGKVVAYKGKIDNHYYLKYTDSSVTEVKFKYYLMFRKSDTINLKIGLEPK